MTVSLLVLVLAFVTVSVAGVAAAVDVAVSLALGTADTLGSLVEVARCRCCANRWNGSDSLMQLSLLSMLHL